MQQKRVVVIGGGTGTHTVLRGLKQYKEQLDIATVVTMADSGGSTGRLRDEFGYLPVGDVRMALTALASEVGEHEELLRELFLYRFAKGDGLSGHNFGNLLLVALTDILGSEEAAIAAAGRVLRVCGRVVPVTTEKVDLVATYADGKTVTGENEIDEPAADRLGQAITQLSLTPTASISESAESVVQDADLIVFGPGDLYTSVLANCVVSGVPEAIQNSGAKIVYICNLMTKAGQTSGMGVAEHAAEVEKYIGQKLDVVLVNEAPLPKDLLEKYATDNEYPVISNCAPHHCNVVGADLVATEAVETAAGDILKRSLIRHNPQKVAEQLLALL